MGSNERVFAILMLCGIIGICFAILLQLLNEQGIIVDEFITGSVTVTLPELQLGAILLWELFGLVLAAIKQ